MPPVTTAPVVVTGAGGFIASHLVQQLLAAGYSVRGTVRDPSAAKNQFLRDFEGAADRLELISADLLTEGAFDNVVAGAEYVLHTASPFILTVKDNQKDLVDPAVNGTLNVLRACHKAQGIKRVIVTSSVAAVQGGQDGSRALTEDDWNTKSTIKDGYPFSKVCAEKAAWKFMEDEKPSFDLIVLNPSMVVGPAFNNVVNQSVYVVQAICKGEYPAIFDFHFSFIDVRDCARAHFLAVHEHEKFKQGRHLITHTSYSLGQICKALRDAGFPAPSFDLSGPFGSGLVKLIAYTKEKGVREYIHENVGSKGNLDNSKIKNIGFTFIDGDKTFADTAVDLAKWGNIKAPKKAK